MTTIDSVSSSTSSTPMPTECPTSPIPSSSSLRALLNWKLGSLSPSPMFEKFVQNDPTGRALLNAVHLEAKYVYMQFEAMTFWHFLRHPVKWWNLSRHHERLCELHAALIDEMLR